MKKQLEALSNNAHIVANALRTAGYKYKDIAKIVNYSEAWCKQNLSNIEVDAVLKQSLQHPYVEQDFSHLSKEEQEYVSTEKCDCCGRVYKEYPNYDYSYSENGYQEYHTCSMACTLKHVISDADGTVHELTKSAETNINNAFEKLVMSKMIKQYESSRFKNIDYNKCYEDAKTELFIQVNSIVENSFDALIAKYKINTERKEDAKQNTEVTED